MTAVYTSELHMQRCPACGQRMEQRAPTQCPLCLFQFADDRVTNADVTPYAQAYARRLPGRRCMSEWIWLAGSGRLNHLALMRASAASRQFALVYCAFLAAGAGLYQTTLVGWKWTAVSSTTESKPAGEGWFTIARDQAHGAAQRVTDLSWNPAQSLIVLVTAGLGAMAGLVLLATLVRWGVRVAHAAQYRGEQRMTAALHYSTAWGVPVLVAALIIGMKPLAYVGEAARWRWIPAAGAFDYAAAVPAGFGLAMWWFWLVRLGATAPTRTRARVVGLFVFVVPLLLVCVCVAWWEGLRFLFPIVFSKLDIAF